MLGPYPTTIKIHTHDTGPSLNTGDKVTPLHIHTARQYQSNMAIIVDDNVDWGTYKGDATNARELLTESPEQYFRIINDELELRKTQVSAEYEKNSRYETTGNVVRLQILHADARQLLPPAKYI